MKDQEQIDKILEEMSSLKDELHVLDIELASMSKALQVKGMVTGEELAKAHSEVCRSILDVEAMVKQTELEAEKKAKKFEVSSDK